MTAAVAILLGSPGLTKRLLAAVAGRLGRIGRTVTRIGGRILDALGLGLRQPGALAEAMAYSTIFYVTVPLFHVLVLHGVGAPIAVGDAVAIAPVILLLSLLPVSFNGLGVAEGFFVLFYMQAGVPGELALAAAILRRLINMGVSLLGAGFWIAYRPPGTAMPSSAAAGGPEHGTHAAL